MKKLTCILLLLSLFSVTGCSSEYPDAVKLIVDFSWEGVIRCKPGNPQIDIKGIPEQTKRLIISMYDHVYKWDHGEASIAYDGSGHIGRGILNTIKAPCPQEEPGKYEITIKALDQNEIVIGVGKKARFFPEKK